ncbi:MAG: hypothetical protein ACYC9Z_18725, partial [Casimicrobiaceae bacterium]
MLSIGEPSIRIGRPMLSIGEPSIRIERPMLSIGEPSIRVGRQMLSIGEPSIRVGRPMFSIVEPSIRVERPMFSIVEPSISIDGQTTRGGGSPSSVFVTPTSIDCSSFDHVERPKDDDGRPSHVSVKAKDDERPLSRDDG